MKLRLFLAFALLAFSTANLLALTPVKEARNHLEHALGLLNKKEEGAGTKRKTSIPFILSVLSNTEVRLKEIRGNKGTNINAALQFVAEAKTELEAAKEGRESELLQKAEAALQEALKRVRKIAEIKQANK